MTNILVVKTSSMGDVIHTLPAITDACEHIDNAQFTWVIEPAFAEIPYWHPKVVDVITVPFRQFRKHPLQVLQRGELQTFFSQLRQKRFDYVIDAQGLIKSAVIARFAKGLRCGLDRQSAWEPLACSFYQQTVSVEPSLHAITRMRTLFSKILDYSIDISSPNYGLAVSLPAIPQRKPYVLFIHGTTWETKEWPELYWQQLAELVVAEGLEVVIPWGNQAELERAHRIKGSCAQVHILPKSTLTELAAFIQGAVGIISVDTGLSHLAAALNTPTITIYGPTDPDEIGTIGENQQHLKVAFDCAPCWKEKCSYPLAALVKPACFEMIPPKKVWSAFTRIVSLEA